MDVNKFVEILGADFFTGVPDSQLKELADYLLEKYGTDGRHHIIAANEGNSVALAAGYHLATGKIPVVYMQNSGEGNAINPIASLLSEQVYGIPVVFVVGWRGEPGVHDEPQHALQGAITIDLLRVLGIESFVLGKDTTEQQFKAVMDEFRHTMSTGKSVAVVVRKGALETAGLKRDATAVNANNYVLRREEAIRCIISVAGEDMVVCTTGKASRELFELRERMGQSHKTDFLTVGSMGHSSSIALGIALQQPTKKIWCIDGDGAALMHMGALATIGAYAPANFVHVVLNNECHESVGGMPTVAGKILLPAIAKSCGYKKAVSVQTSEELEKSLALAKKTQELTFVECKCAKGARNDLGRPTTSPIENKKAFMEHFLIE